MISADRFIETSDNYEAWLAARRGGATATEVAKAATPAGFREVMQNRANPQPVEVNEFMRFGSDNEDWIARVLKRDFDLMPNRWLIAADGIPQHMATPDALSLNHEWIGEIKTGGTAPVKDGLVVPPIAHRRQIQWQLHCTGAESCVYAYMLRAESAGVMVPAWLEPLTVLVPRDEQMIADLVKVADQLLIDFEGWEAA